MRKHLVLRFEDLESPENQPKNNEGTGRRTEERIPSDSQCSEMLLDREKLDGKSQKQTSSLHYLYPGGKPLSNQDAKMLFKAPELVFFDLLFLENCSNLHSNPIFQQYAQILDSWNRINDGFCFRKYDQKVCKEIYQVLRKAAILCHEDALLELQKSMIRLSPHLKKNSEPDIELRMPRPRADSLPALLAKRRSSSEQSLEKSSNMQATKVLQQNRRSASTHDSHKYEYIANKRKLNDLRLYREIEEIRNMKSEHWKVKNRQKEERLKYQKYASIPNRQPLRLILAQNARKESSQIVPVDGIKLLKEPVYSFKDRKEKAPVRLKITTTH